MNTSEKKTLGNRMFQHPLGHSLAAFGGFSIFYTLFFSPVLLSNNLVAPGDGLVYFLPALYSPKHLWTDLIFAGYPLAADPQNMSWYLPSFILGLVPSSWNAFVILAYILASSFSYYYVYSLTSSVLAATVSGLIYGLSGFMIHYLQVAIMIHVAAWMPLIVLALEKLRHKVERIWLAVGILAIATCILAGNPQISVYVLSVSFFYALFLGWTASIGRWKYYRWVSIIFILGFLIAALQILPTVELSRLSVRSEISYNVFLEGSLNRLQALYLFFPLFYWGGLRNPIYVGLLPLLLAPIGLKTFSQKRIAYFWFWVGTIAFLLMFGEGFLLGKVLYEIPIHNLFRIQSRHSLEFAFSVSILAGLGISSIQNNLASNRLIRQVIVSGSIIFAFILLGINAFHTYFKSQAELIGIEQLSVIPWLNKSIGIPCLVFIFGVISLILWRRWRNFRFGSLILVAVLLFDLLSFAGWNWDFSSGVISKNIASLKEPYALKSYRLSLKESHQRFLPSQGIWASLYPELSIYPNLTRLWNLPSVGGYSPLILSRFSEMMRMDFAGVLNPSSISPIERQLDLMAVRYLLTASDDMLPQEGLAWADPDLNITLGSGACVPATESTNHTLNPANHLYQATTISIVSLMGCSVEIPNNAELLEVRVVDANGSVETHSLLAGRDTSEYAYDCPDVQPLMQHQKAKVFESTLTERPDGEVCQAHSYVSKIQLNRAQQIRNIQLSWKNLPALINISHVSLSHDSKATSLPVTLLDVSPKWKKIEILEGGIVYENQDVLPRTWLVPETLTLQPEEVLAAIHTSQLPDGQIYDPKMMALVEDSAATLQSSALQTTDYASVLNITETQVELEAQTTAPAFLVLSDVFYPGWKATIDGQSTRIFPTNYIQRGVKLPPGKHIVLFEFYPLSFRVGLGITVASCFACVYVLSRRS